jgi:hypothetical protein
LMKEDDELAGKFIRNGKYYPSMPFERQPTDNYLPQTLCSLFPFLKINLPIT